MAEERLAYISNNVLTILKNKWNNAREVKFEPLKNRKGEEQYQSIAIFGDFVIEFDEKEENDEIDNDNKEGEEQIEELVGDFAKTQRSKDSKRIGVVIKMQICDHLAMAWTNGGLNFFNEIFFYSEILPYFNSKLQIKDTFPKLIHGYFSDSKREDDIIILKNLNTENFRLTESKTVLSLEHILLSLRKLGRFHACSYIMKSLDRATFMEKVKSLKVIKTWIYDPGNPAYEHFQKSAQRPASYLDKFPEYKIKLSESGYSKFFDNLQTSMPKLYEANERMSVICHGDFNRNNMLFKYENKDRCKSDEKNTFEGNIKAYEESKEIPIDVRFFDLGDVIYGTPVLDLSFFLFMNTSQQMRDPHWDTMLQTYHESLRTECEQFPDVAFPSYEDICKEFKVNFMLGFMISMFFLPMMMKEKKKDRSEWTDKPTEEEMEEFYAAGGDKATKAVGEILMFVLDKGFI